MFLQASWHFYAFPPLCAIFVVALFPCRHGYFVQSQILSSFLIAVNFIPLLLHAYEWLVFYPWASIFDNTISPSHVPLIISPYGIARPFGIAHPYGLAHSIQFDMTLLYNLYRFKNLYKPTCSSKIYIDLRIYIYSLCPQIHMAKFISIHLHGSLTNNLFGPSLTLFQIAHPYGFTHSIQSDISLFCNLYRF